ncbi:MAG: type II secretion system F family protein [Rhizobiales bacterium]|nr:type II secretion system F family protein [Hyphomicrobiales bacterium]
MQQILTFILDPQILFMILIAIATFATVMTIALPAISRDRMSSRMKVMATQREQMRAQRLQELAALQNRGALRHKPKDYMQQIVDRFNLRNYLDTEDVRERLKMAGFRGQSPVVAFMFFRLTTPVIVFCVVLVYLVFAKAGKDMMPIMKIGIALAGAYIGYYLPNLFLSNIISRRQTSIANAFPDALDLLLICVQAGMSVEAAFGKVSQEVASQSLELAEELSLTTAELSYLSERRQAYENLGKRTGLAQIKATATSLIQAERYGTPVGQALRVMAKENRDMRMSEAEKKAAALPPKLTVPMIVFFLPVLFVVILGPAVVRVMRMQ